MLQWPPLDASQADSDDVYRDTFDGSNCCHLESAAPPGTDRDQRFRCARGKNQGPKFASMPQSHTMAARIRVVTT